MNIKKDVRIIGGTAKIVEIENGKIIRVIEDYKEYLKRKKESKLNNHINPIIRKNGNEKCLKKEDDATKKILCIGDIINIINSNVTYREPGLEIREGKFRTRFRNYQPYIGIDNKTLKIINKILEDPVEKRKFPSISDYIIDCISKWTSIYSLVKDKDSHLYYSAISISNHKNIKRMFSIASRRFELDYIDLKNILLSQDMDKLVKFRDNFVNHINMSLSYQTSFIDQKLTINKIISDNTLRTIIDHLELRGLLPKDYIEVIKNTKFERNCINLIEYDNNIQNIEYLIETILSPPIIFDDKLEILLSYYLDNIRSRSERFEIIQDYIFMCAKEWTEVYCRIYHYLPSNYGYMLDIENMNYMYDNYVKPICDNYLDSIRKDASLIPNFKEFRYEIDLDKWFRNNYQLFGFSNIRRSGVKGGADFLCQYKDVDMRVELEYESGNFLKHKHNPDVVDMVICYKKNKNLSIPVIPILELSKEI